MHELGIAQQTLDMAVAETRRQGASRVLAMRLRIGDLSGVVPEALQFALETIVEGTPAAGARIDIERVLPACYCVHCKREFEVSDSSYACPDCGEISVDMRHGKEMDLVSLEVA